MSSITKFEQAVLFGVPTLYQTMVEARDKTISRINAQTEGTQSSLTKAKKFKLEGKKVVTKALFEVGSALVTPVAMIDYLVAKFSLGFFAEVAVRIAPDWLDRKDSFKDFTKKLIQAEEMSRRTCLEGVTGLVNNFFVAKLKKRNKERNEQVTAYTRLAHEAMTKEQYYDSEEFYSLS